MGHRSDGLRTALIVVATAGLTSVLLPLGVQAAGTLMTIVDDDTASKAQVESGKLRVGDGSGALTVNGTVGTVAAGAPFKLHLTDTVGADVVHFVSNSYTVPPGKRLIITRVSGAIQLPSPQSVIRAGLIDSQDATPGAATLHYFAYDAAVTADGVRHLTFSDDVVIPVPAGETIRMDAERTDGAGIGRLYFYVSGYLTNA